MEKMIIQKVKFKSSFKFFIFKTNFAILGKGGKFYVSIRNCGDKLFPGGCIRGELKYYYPVSGTIKSQPLEHTSMSLTSAKIPQINPRKKKESVLVCDHMPPVAETRYPASFQVEITTNGGEKVTSYQKPITLTIDEETAKNHCRNRAVFWISIITLIFVLFSLIISLIA